MKRFEMPDDGKDWANEECYLTDKLKAELKKMQLDQDKIHELTTRIREAVYKQRDEILRAFVAQYGCLPDECVQVEESTPKGYRWHVRKRTPEEMQTGKHE